MEAVWESKTKDLRLFHGCMRDVLRSLPPDTFHSCVTDPPYELAFMGRGWDNSGIAFDPTSWSEVLRVLRPGAHLLAFGGSRTFHRMAVAIEDAGFEIRDTLLWLYGSGFPKSLDVSKAIDKQDAAELRLQRRYRFTEWIVSACELSPATMDLVCGTNTMGRHWTDRPPDGKQPDITTREHFEKLRPHFTCAVPEWVERMVDERTVESENFKRREIVVYREMTDTTKARAGFSGATHSPDYDGTKRVVPVTRAATEAAKQWDGWGSALKPAFEPIILARKPLDGTIAANVLKWGCGALNIWESRVNPGDHVPGGGGLKGGAETRHDGWQRPSHASGQSTESHHKGRYPANVLHDGSPEVVGMFPETTSGKEPAGGFRRNKPDDDEGIYGGGRGLWNKAQDAGSLYGDSGSAARFFWSPKASAAERPEHTTADGRTVRHPTVKPLALIEYLVRLITPPGGHCLDPYAGSGTTLEACYRLNMRALGIELEADHVPLIAARLEQAMGKHLLPGMD